MSGGSTHLPIEPRPAVVVPRAVPSAGGAELPLHIHIERFLRERKDIIVRIVGKPGGGRTTALMHLAAVLPKDLNVRLVDFGDPIPNGTYSGGFRAVVAVSSFHPAATSVFNLLGWNDDDAIQYVVHRFPREAKRILSRYLADPTRSLLEELPAMIAAVLDYLATDATADSVSTALAKVVASLEGADDPDVGECACSMLYHRVASSDRFASGTVKWLRYSAAQLLLTSAHLLKSVQTGERLEHWMALHPRPDVVRISSAPLRANPVRIEPLKSFAESCPPEYLPMTMSLISQADPTIAPPSRKLNLKRAVLNRARWARARMASSDLRLIQCADADLSECDLSDSLLSGSTLNRTRLTSANLSGADISHASLVKVDLTSSNAAKAIFSYSDLSGSRLMNAILREALFESSDLRAVDFSAADLFQAVFRTAKIAGADFTGAKLVESCFREMAFCARFDGADFTDADLRTCSLAGCRINGLQLSGADLSGCDCTGSEFSSARMSGANLQNAGLAEIEWPRADLRVADFTHASFHMGSTRSGLVGSPIAREGSMTGFYTDEYFEQDYRPPEEIRKANLCGADLRGAIVDGTDWYLVDFRKAKYETSQAGWFRKCGAILESR